MIKITCDVCGRRMAFTNSLRFISKDANVYEETIIKINDCCEVCQKKINKKIIKLVKSELEKGNTK